MNEYDVVVVGGRVAGASTALLLARAGVRVVLVDRDRYGSDTLSTLALTRGGVVQLARWGVLPDVAAAGTPPIRQVVFHYADGEPVSVEIKPSATAMAESACRTITAADARDRVMMASFETEALERFRAACPDVATSASADEAGRYVTLTALPFVSPRRVGIDKASEALGVD